jgi:hypothetical protein
LPGVDIHLEWHHKHQIYLSTLHKHRKKKYIIANRDSQQGQVKTKQR